MISAGVALAAVRFAASNRLDLRSRRRRGYRSRDAVHRPLASTTTASENRSSATTYVGRERAHRCSTGSGQNTPRDAVSCRWPTPTVCSASTPMLIEGPRRAADVFRRRADAAMFSASGTRSPLDASEWGPVRRRLCGRPRAHPDVRRRSLLPAAGRGRLWSDAGCPRTRGPWRSCENLLRRVGRLTIYEANGSDCRTVERWIHASFTRSRIHARVLPSTVEDRTNTANHPYIESVEEPVLQPVDSQILIVLPSLGNDLDPP